MVARKWVGRLLTCLAISFVATAACILLRKLGAISMDDDLVGFIEASAFILAGVATRKSRRQINAGGAPKSKKKGKWLRRGTPTENMQARVSYVLSLGVGAGLVAVVIGFGRILDAEGLLKSSAHMGTCAAGAVFAIVTGAFGARRDFAERFLALRRETAIATFGMLDVRGWEEDAAKCGSALPLPRRRSFLASTVILCFVSESSMRFLILWMQGEGYLRQRDGPATALEILAFLLPGIIRVLMMRRRAAETYRRHSLT